jgi:hypothetical protein
VYAASRDKFGQAYRATNIMTILYVTQKMNHQWIDQSLRLYQNKNFKFIEYIEFCRNKALDGKFASLRALKDCNKHL